ncbi:MAG: Ig-like domain-containing protein, partial [Verrucomicrobia bacterium]|nr:Ig-like domain-containing protein [Verrucomicrobiota bacterium]
DAGAQSIPNATTNISPGPANESSQTVSFTVTNTNNALFSIQPAISSNGTLSFTSAPNANGVATVSVTAVDNGGTANGGLNTSAARTFSLTVTPVNDAPTNITLNATSLAENNATNATVGTLSATDIDSADTHTFSLVTGTGSTDNDSFTITGNALKLTASADFETKSSYSIRIRATDSGSPVLSFEKAFTITITNVNEAPLANAQSITTNEDTAASITLNGSDVDASTTLTYSIVTSPTNGILTGSGTSRTYTPSANFNGSDSFTFKTNDGSLDSTTATVSITVNAVNDAPSFALPAGASGSGGGALWAWGYNEFGMVGNGNQTTQNLPVQVVRTGVLNGKTPSEVSIGQQHAFVLCTDGTLATWGRNLYGMLGNGTTTNSSVPVLVNRSGVLAGKTVTAMAAGGVHCLVLCSDGTLATWGNGSNGELGNGGSTLSSVPVLVNRTGVLAGKTVTQLTAGGLNSLLLCSDGSLVTWGAGNVGQLGNGANSQSSLPVLVNRSGVLAGKTVTKLSIGSNHSLVLCSDGTVVSWGINSSGQLGNNSIINSNVPVLVNMSGVLAGKTVTHISAGPNHSAVLCSDGTIATWGRNAEGQLGNGTFNASNLPVLVDRSGVLAGKTITDVKCLATLTYALCSDGSLASWGEGWYGALGNGSTTNASTPVLVTTSAMPSGQKIVALPNKMGDGYAPVVIVGTPTTGVYDLTVPAAGAQSVASFATNISAGPANESAQTVSFNVTNSNNALFSVQPAISSSGTLTFTPAAIGSATVTVIAQDNGGTAHGGLDSSAAQTFTITLTNSAPTNIALSVTSIDENNAANATVGTLSATDADSSQTHTFSLVTGTGSTDNASFTLTGSTLKITPSANFEAKSSYTIRIRATDSGSPALSFEKAFTITINDVNEAVIALSGNSQAITNGDITPTAADHTDFGSTGVATGSVTRSFTIRNPGLNDLLLTGLPKVAVSGPHAAEFTISVAPASTVTQGGGTTTFQVVFDPAATGLRSATLSIVSNDPVNSTFSFAIQGAGLSSNADLASLTLGTGTGTLTPAFAANTTSYTSIQTTATSSLTFTATAADANATLSGSTSPLALNVGSNTLTVLVTAEDAVTTKTYTAVVTRQTAQQTNYDNGIASWAVANGLPPGTSTDADSDGDGVSNLAEFAFGTNPASGTIPAAGFTGTFANATLTAPGMPIAAFEPNSAGVDNRALFTRRTDSASMGITYTVQFSATLGTWQNSTATPTVLAAQNGVELVSVKFPLTVGGRKARFMRISVKAP